MTCPSAADRCVKSHTEATAANVTVTAYVKGCSTSAACNRGCSDLPLANITKCEFDCCSGDLCNGAIPTPKPRLKCYRCFSLKSWADCKTNRKLMTCPSAADRCAKSHIEATAANVTVTAYVIGCSTSAACNRGCNDLPLANITKCEFDCCSGNLCNGAIPTPKPRLKCYQCFSLKSWADCAANKREVTCPSGADHCGTAHVEARVVGVPKAAYNAGCFTSAACSRDICKSYVSYLNPWIKCEFACCKGNLCNAAKLMMK